jgi:hypothetical protein
MRQLAAAVTVAAAGILVAACGGGNGGGSSSSSSTTTTTSAKPPLAQAALANLLLAPADIDKALGVTGTKTDKPFDALQPDQTATSFPKGYTFPAECVYATDAGLVPVYADSGNTAVKGEHDVAAAPDGSNDPPPDADQFVVLFPSADKANAFFTTSTQKWPACANRQDTVPGDPDTPDIQWKLGAVNNSNGVLTVTATVTASKNGQSIGQQSCQRALTVRNNVVVDTMACNKDAGSSAVTIANQIAGKVDKQ